MKGIDPEKARELLRPKRLWINVMADALLEYAKSKPNGFTWVQAARHLGIKERSVFYGVVQQVRLDLADDEMTLTCAPEHGRGPWTYRLVGMYEDAEAWATNRIGDAETRLHTMASYMAPVVRTTPDNTLDGQKARLIERGVRHLHEDLEALRASFNGQ